LKKNGYHVLEFGKGVVRRTMEREEESTTEGVSKGRAPYSTGQKSFGGGRGEKGKKGRAFKKAGNSHWEKRRRKSEGSKREMKAKRVGQGGMICEAKKKRGRRVVKKGFIVLNLWGGKSPSSEGRGI